VIRIARQRLNPVFLYVRINEIYGLLIRGGLLLRIRLTRMGAKKKPFYRVVVVERRRPRDGSFLEILGHYNPTTNPPLVELNMDRVRHWLACGAQPSETVHSLLKKAAPPSPAAAG
jgi:small subunit ribosomal protein S16